MAVQHAIVERSDDVLWSLSPKGIILHNLTSGGYIELDQDGYRAWGFLDGGRAVDEVVARCTAPGDAGNAGKRRKLLKIIGKLLEHGFAEEVRYGRA